MRLQWLLPAGAMFAAALVVMSLTTNGAASFDEAGRNIRFRQIGHQLLLAAGDHSSKVLPVSKVSQTAYSLNFETAFAFMPDSLVTIVNKAWKNSTLPAQFIVNVVKTANNKVVYGFESGRPAPCLGRELPKDNYSITILLGPASFAEQLVAKGTYPVIFTIITGSLLTVMLIVVYKRRQNMPAEENLYNAAKPDAVTIGKYVFYPARQLLVVNHESIGLTYKESKLLNVFAGKLNFVIDRNRLLKEVWEDEGVFTTRSLDMYISKLRKKLQQDPSLSIVNIHGIGYKLSDIMA